MYRYKIYFYPNNIYRSKVYFKIYILNEICGHRHHKVNYAAKCILYRGKYFNG